MAITTWMMGDALPLPFLGHFRSVLRCPYATLWLAGRIGVIADDVQEVFDVAHRLKAVLSAVTEGKWAQTDRHGLLRGVWETIATIPAPELGSLEGADLSLLMVAQDRRGVGLSGVGLSGVWGRYDHGLVPMVEENHPLLSVPGRPETVPGVLTLNELPLSVVGRPFHLDMAPAEDVSKLALSCGVRT